MLHSRPTQRARRVLVASSASTRYSPTSTSVDVAAVRDCSTPSSNTFNATRYVVITPRPAPTPAGTEKRATSRRKPIRPPRALARSEREEERRYAHGERADHGEMARQEGVLGRRQADRDDQERSKDRLGDEQLRHPLDVAKDAPAFRHHPRHRREVAAHQHDVGDRLRHVGARALCERQSRRLERRHVVDAVTDHRHVPAARGERLDEAALVLRSDPTDHRDRRRKSCQLAALRRQLGSLQRLGHDEPHVARDRGRRARVVSREHLDVDAFGEQERNRLPRIAAQLLGEDDEAEHTGGRGACIRVVRKLGRGPREAQHAEAVSLPARRLLGKAVELEVLGSAEDQRLRAERKPAPPPAREEGDAAGHLLAGAADPGNHGVEHAVPGARRGGEAPQLPRQLLLGDPVGGQEPDDAQPRLGDRPRLVDAERVDGRERLDRV